jgi:hypothetical protein
VAAAKTRNERARKEKHPSIDAQTVESSDPAFNF